MSIKEFYEKIESFPSDTMNFCIEDVFSWRGVYAEPACSLLTCQTSKLHNLDMLHRLLNETFIGWKGGSYKYSFDHDINFEPDAGAWTDGKYLINFIANNPSPEVRHIFG